MDKEAYLKKFIFEGLTNLNDGFDSERIKYFSQQDFEIILNRVEDYGLGIYAIEPWKDGEFYDVITWEDNSDHPANPSWYKYAFIEFTKKDGNLMYSASYYIPEKLLE